MFELLLFIQKHSLSNQLIFGTLPVMFAHDVLDVPDHPFDKSIGEYVFPVLGLLCQDEVLEDGLLGIQGAVPPKQELGMNVGVLGGMRTCNECQGKFQPCRVLPRIA